MNKDILITVKQQVISAINDTNIDLTDKLELLINITHFLDENTYDDNIKTLQKTK